MAAAPVLFDVRQGGKSVPAVAAVSKVGLLFLLDRVTGKPIYGVEERPVPPSEVPLERAAKTQPFPLKPPPLSRMTFSAADIATVTPEIGPACRKLIEGMQLGGPYLPVSYNRLRVQFPGNHGGVNWGGTRAARARVPVREHERNGTGLRLSATVNRRRGLPRAAAWQSRASRGPVSGHAGRRPLQHPQRHQYAAVDVSAAAMGPAHRGERSHRRVRVARAAGRHRQPSADKQNTGRPGNGGTIVTAGGLVFVGATETAGSARSTRRPAKRCGRSSYRRRRGDADHLPGARRTTIVVITATGGGFFNNPTTDDSVMAFALPRPGGGHRRQSGDGKRGCTRAPASQPVSRAASASMARRASRPTSSSSCTSTSPRAVLAPAADDAAVAPDCRFGVAVAY